MRLNVVSFSNEWRGDLSVLRENAVNLPASVSGWRMLSDEGIPYVTLSELLSPSDFQDIWKESLMIVWAALRTAKASESNEIPDLVAIHANSLYYLLGQILVVGRALDHLLKKHPITEVQIEDPDDQDQEPYLFYAAECSAFYHEVVRIWAARHQIPLHIRREAHPKRPVHRKTWAHQWEGRGIELRFALKRKLRDIVIKCCFVPRMISWCQRRSHTQCGRTVVFGYPQASTGVSCRGIIARFRNAHSMILKFTADKGDLPELAHSLDRIKAACRSIPGVWRPMVEKRWIVYQKRTGAKGFSIFRGFNRELKKMLVRGERGALLASSPWNDYSGLGFAAAAFRQAGFPVAGVQHGGNQHVIQKAGVPVPLAEGVGGTFFVWGKGGPDEMSFYGLDAGTRFVRAGSPRMKDLCGRASGKRAPGIGRILYAPTFVNIMTMQGDQIPWDVYVPHLLKVCQRLNSSGRPVWVKILDIPEMKHLHLERFNNIIVLHKGVFSDYMVHADYLLVDSLGGSPIYEAMATERPILLYAGIENQSWDTGFLQAVQKRAACFWNSSSYFEGLNSFLKDPITFFSSFEKNSHVLDNYLNPTSPRTFWDVVEGELFKGVK
jgi:hypothetical protein